MENKDWTGYAVKDGDNLRLAGHVTGVATHPDRPDITLITVKQRDTDGRLKLYVLWSGADWANHVNRGDFVTITGVITAYTSYGAHSVHSVTSVEFVTPGYLDNMSVIAAVLDAEKRAADRAYRIRVATEELAGL